VHAAAAHHREQQILQRVLLQELGLPERREMLDRDRRADLVAERIELGRHRAGARVEPLLQAGALLLHVLQHRLCRGQRQRVAHEGAGEIGDAHGRHRVVAELPAAAVERIHELALAGDHADRITAADHLAVGGEVGLDAEQRLGAAGMGAEAGDDLVEDAQRAGRGGDLAHLAQEIDRLEIGPPALHRLDQHGGQFVRTRADDLQRLGCAVVQHDHVLRGVAHDPRRRRHRAQLPGAAHDHFVDDAVVGAAEQHHGAAPGHRARHPQRAQHGLGAGVAQIGRAHV